MTDHLDGMADIMQSQTNEINMVIRSCMKLADKNAQLQTDKAELLEGLRKMVSWAGTLCDDEKDFWQDVKLCQALITKHSGAGETG